MQRYKLILEYDGSNFHGWRSYSDSNPDAYTSIKSALEKFLQHEVEPYVAARTDSGVHAVKQVIHIDTKKKIQIRSLLLGSNFYLRKNNKTEISVKHVIAVKQDFHARFSAKQRHYRYLIINDPTPTPLYRNHALHFLHKLNIKNMIAASSYLIGTHNLTSFQNTGSIKYKSPIWSIDSIRITKKYKIITIDIKAPSFRYRQVRNIVGTLLLFGSSKLEPEYMQNIISAENRNAAGNTANACGLYLMGVSY